MQETALRRGRAIAPTITSVAPYVLWPLVAAGLGELFLFRTLSRVGVHIPKEDAVLRAYNLLVQVGSYAFNLSSVAAVAAVLLVASAALRGEFGRRPLLAAAAPAMILFAILSALSSAVDQGPTMKFLYGVVSAGLMVVLAAQAWTDRRNSPARAFAIGLTVLAYLAAQYSVLANHAYQALDLTPAPPGGVETLEIAEALVLVNTAVIFREWSGVRFRRGGRPSLLQAAVAVLLVAGFLGSYYGRPGSSTAAILSLWSLGLTLYLPVPLYAAALALYGMAVVGCLQRLRREGTPPWDLMALGLLPVAGLTLEMTYQHLLALLVLSLLIVANEGERPAVAREAKEAAPPRLSFNDHGDHGPVPR